MSILNPVFLVLGLVFVTGVIGDPPIRRREDSGYPKFPVGDQCKRKDFIDKGKVTDYLQQLEPDTDMQTVLDILGNAVTEAIKLCIKRNIPLGDLEIIGEESYICSSRGEIPTINSLYATSWKYLGDVAPDKNSNDPLEFKVTFHFIGGIISEYYKSYVELSTFQKFKGSFQFRIKEAQIDLTVITDTYSNMMDKLKKQQCFLHVKSVQASLPGATNYMGLVETYNLYREKVMKMLSSKLHDIKEDISNQAKAAFYEGLVHSGGWVCLDDDVKELMTSTKKTISTKNFNTHCDSNES